ncbi:hypothetical protein TcYC6_0079110 [Trypanosoma cruzi]|uniref:Uncharacterized protein n=1 Tax=Trypanosoma cruzi (strain CL Brener) TaxID=353153 RepID=Q4DBU1_TRYCC|nr:hypothetical protein, conserved [Trypanosoma cruzi]EAN89997.1 hypothetical protein, conserved [Trypanosoma cruzi]KAF8297522.1 hypothetical protein TcYC6_0079110 [Trypanosoma cruzi]RNC59694.1 hypothetical protein TcCL_ESM02607 [Trypanosoma cruzi]|eukprot:XP_811848.1 hypothetical protein [Trypanosoma cruzi strain CL Brener]
MSLLGGNSVSSWAGDETHGGGPRYGETARPGNVSAAFNAGQATSAANREGNSDIVAARPQRKPLLVGSNEQCQLECLASIAYLVGSPLQRNQPTVMEPVQRSMKLVRELLRRGVDPEKVIRVIESREGVSGAGERGC